MADQLFAVPRTPGPRGATRGATPRLRLGVLFVRRFELFHEAGEEPGAFGFARGRVVVHEIPAAPAEHFAHRGRSEVAHLGHDLVRAKEVENFIGVAENAPIERIDEKGQVADEAPHDEMSGQSDRLELDAQPLRHEQIDDAQGERDAGAPLEDLVDEVIERKMDEGLLDECPLTLADIKKLSASFRFTLLNLMHSRIAYTQEEEKADKAEAEAKATA